MRPKVSILITSYNHEDFLEECILSAINCDYEDKEMLIVDDASTDSSHEILSRYENHFSKVIVLKTNKGACIAVNQLLKHATGEYVSILNSDDIFLPGKVRAQADYLDANPDRVAVFSQCRIIDEEGKPNEVADFPFDFKNRDRLQWLKRFFLKGNCLCLSTVMMRRVVFEEIGFFDERLRSLPDFDFWVRILAVNEIFILPKEFLLYRRCRDRISESAPSLKNFNRALFETERILEHYVENNAIRRDLGQIFEFGLEPQDDVKNLALLSVTHELLSHRNFGLNLLFHYTEKAGVDTKERVELLKKLQVFIGSSSGTKNLEIEYEAQFDSFRMAMVDEIDHAYAKIRMMSSSFSWKITSPLRFLRRLKESFLCMEKNSFPEGSKISREVVTQTPKSVHEFEMQPHEYDMKQFEYEKKSLLIDWIIPDFQVGSGGHTTIFRIIHHLEKMGHRSKIWICGKTHFKSLRIANNVLKGYFFPLSAEMGILDNSLSCKLEGDCIFSTSFETCYYSRSLPSEKPRFYLVQDYEPDFFAIGSKHFLAKETYKFGFNCITAGKWLLRKTQSAGGNCIGYFDLAVDHSLFFQPLKPPVLEVPVVVVYSRAGTERRLSEMVIHGLNLLACRNIQFKVMFFGAKKIPVAAQFPHEILGVLKPRDLASLYRKSTVGCVFSATNYSLVPLEMMACGLPVVEFDGENTRETFPEACVTFSSPSPLAISKTVEGLLLDEQKRASQSSNAAKFVEKLSWQVSCKKIEQLILSQLDANNLYLEG